MNRMQVQLLKAAGVKENEILNVAIAENLIGSALIDTDAVEQARTAIATAQSLLNMPSMHPAMHKRTKVASSDY